MKSSLAMFSRCHASTNCGAIASVNVLRRQARGLGGLLDLQAVLVGAGEEVHVVAEQAVPAGERVADDGRVGVAEVRLGVDVVDGGGEEVVAHDGSFRRMAKRAAGLEAGAHSTGSSRCSHVVKDTS